MKNASIFALFFCGMAINLHAQNDTEIKTNPFETKQIYVAPDAYEQHIQVAFVALDLGSNLDTRILQVDTPMFTAALPIMDLSENEPSTSRSKIQSIREKYNQ